VDLHTFAKAARAAQLDANPESAARTLAHIDSTLEKILAALERMEERQTKAKDGN
jgi:hypothetical protein